MTEEEAKLYLCVHRDSDPVPDEKMAAAHALLAESASLRAWYGREQECIEALDAKMGEITPPAGLRTRILELNETASHCAVTWYKRRSVLGVAALVLISLLAGILWINRPYTSGGTSLSAYQKDMTTYLDRFFLLDFESEKLEEVTDWLARTRNVEKFVVPTTLASRPSIGCEVIPWHGRLAYLVCFDVDGELYHLFLLPGGAVLRNEEDNYKEPGIDPKWAFTSWTDGNDLYFCCSLSERDDFRRVLELTEIGAETSA